MGDPDSTTEAAGRPALRSARWFAPRDVAGLIHRAAVRSEGIAASALDGRPVVGICNSWSELVNCNLHFRGLSDAVKRGVLAAGGLPLEFPTISLGENLMKPTTMLFRNLMAMDVEECIRAYPLDSVVLLGGCDKTVPAQLMGAASVDVPAVMVTGGPMNAAWFRGRPLGAGTDLWKYTDDVRAGRMSLDEYDELERAAIPSSGHCNEMGTASTMTALVEALGLALPGTATIPALDARRHAAAEDAGRLAVQLAVDGPTPRAILTPAAFDNAVTLLVALGGSTNAVLHLLALAGRVGVELTLERIDEVARRTPLLVDVRPAGRHLVEDLFRAGGVPAVLRALGDLVDREALTVSGEPLGRALEQAVVDDSGVIRSLDDPLGPNGGLAVLRGSLAPDGAILKVSAATPSLLQHRGPAIVFDGIDDLARRIDDPALPVTPDSVLVLRGCGPVGGPGMPEWGMVPIPQRLLRDGVTDLVRISDARMSGTGFGTVVLHAAPEAAVGGPLAALEDGDPVVLDVDGGRLDVDVPAHVLAARLARRVPHEPAYARGYGALYLQHVEQANLGCDLDFLRATPGAAPDREPLGILSGWIGGW